MPTTQGFFQFIWTSLANRLYLMIGLLVTFASWWLFKKLFPNVNFNFDSYYYIFAALGNDPVHIWPIGYSKFLQVIGLFSDSPNLVAAIQYFFLQFALLVFFFAVRFFFHLGKGASMVLYLFILLNPIYLFTSNFILSDSLFVGISLLWLVNLLLIISRPQPWMLVSHAMLLFLAFTIRQTAVVYPLVACVAILLSRQRRSFKIVGIVLPFLLVGGFIAYSIRMNEVIYGVKTFSPFQGWHAANNALYVYEHVPPEKRLLMPEELQPLDSLVRAYYRSSHWTVSVMTREPTSGCFYIFVYPSPLLQYEFRQFGVERHIPLDPLKFARLGPIYADYGSFVLRHYPITYLKYFVLPNIGLYFYPHPEVYMDIGSFTLREDTLGKIAQKWFRHISVSAPEGSIQLRTSIFKNYQSGFAIIHIVFVLSFAAFVFFRSGKKVGQQEARLLWLMAALWVINFGFTVLAAASVFRFELFIIVMEFALSIYFIESFLETEPN